MSKWLTEFTIGVSSSKEFQKRNNIGSLFFGVKRRTWCSQREEIDSKMKREKLKHIRISEKWGKETIWIFYIQLGSLSYLMTVCSFVD